MKGTKHIKTIHDAVCRPHIFSCCHMNSCMDVSGWLRMAIIMISIIYILMFNKLDI